MHYLFRIVNDYFSLRKNYINWNSKREEVYYSSHCEHQKTLERAFPRIYRALQTQMERIAKNTGRSLNFMEGDLEMTWKWDSRSQTTRGADSTSWGPEVPEKMFLIPRNLGQLQEKATSKNLPSGTQWAKGKFPVTYFQVFLVYTQIKSGSVLFWGGCI